MIFSVRPKCFQSQFARHRSLEHRLVKPGAKGSFFSRILSCREETYVGQRKRETEAKEYEWPQQTRDSQAGIN
eukprot:scaffold599449_cov47-Prasinocladus_malaysianus.AAC.1